MHTESHFLAGKTVQAKVTGASDEGPHDYRVEDWWDKLTGGSWMDADGNPAAINYAIRAGMHHLPIDNEVVYGKIGAFGHLIHVSEILPVEENASA